MKNIRLWLVGVISVIISCQSQKNLTYTTVTIRDVNMEKIIDFFLEEDNEYIREDRDIVLINVYQEGEQLEVRIGALEKQLIAEYRRGTRDQVYGFFEKNKIICAVFGNAASKFFDRQNLKKCISSLSVSKAQREFINGIPAPPLSIEPIVWVYQYDNGNFLLKDKARVQLLR